MSEDAPSTAGGIALPTDRPADAAGAWPWRTERTIRQLADDVDALRRIHFIDLALASSGGRDQARRSAESGADLDDAVTKLIEKLRADGLA